MLNRKRFLSLMLALALVFTLATPAAAVENNTSLEFTEVNGDWIQDQLNAGHIANVTPEEPAYAEDEVLRVSIVLEKKGTIAAGYSPIGIASNTAALNYSQALEKEQKTMEQKISEALGVELDVVWNLTLAANLISANVEFGQIAAIEAVPGVAKVVIETRYEPAVTEKGQADPNMATSGIQTGAFNAWAAGYTGAGTRIAIIDTGADVDHEAFNGGAFEYALSVLAEKAGVSVDEYIESLNLLDVNEIKAVLPYLNAYELEYNRLTAADVYVNAKIAFGYNYVDQDLDLSHYNSEHGSHVAGISTANTYIPSGSGYVEALGTTGVRGVAPEAQLLVMKVFGAGGGAYDSDIMVAIEDAVLLNCDSVNLSLGSSVPGATRNSNAYYNNIMENLVNSGVVVSISAGNNSHWAEESSVGLPYADDVAFHTGGSPGTFTNSLGVASADNAGYTLANYVTVPGYGYALEYIESMGYGNERMKTLSGDHTYVYVDCTGSAEDLAKVGKSLLQGKIVIVNRGDLSFFEKANNAAAMGAAGVIIVNTEYQLFRMDLTGYQYTVPAVAMSKEAGDVFKAMGNGYSKSGIQYYTGTIHVAGTPAVGYYEGAYTMSSFSSWGVPGSLLMKPEITAPGGMINSVAGAIHSEGYFTDSASYEVMSGTSMAAPQIAGMSAVLIQYLRENGLDQESARTLAQSLLMSTAVPMIDGETGNYYPILQQGSGLADVGAAILADSYIIMGEDATASWNDGKVKVELGDDPNKTGEYTFSFTLNNLTDVEKVFVLSGDFFVQALVADGLLLSTGTTSLAPAIEWVVDGKPVENGAVLGGMDFDGNGAVNHADGQALLNYAVGKIDELTNMAKADLDQDGEVDTYDAYLFFDMLEDNGALLPAGGSAEVVVTVKLTETDRAALENYPKGTYLEGYIYAESLATEEGIAGTSHSIPVLGFYGNWSEPSMYDKGSAMEYFHGTETRVPYLYYENYQKGFYNGLIYHDAAFDGDYWFGGNPMVLDEVYMPERNAFTGTNGNTIDYVKYASIRTAGGLWFFVRNVDTGEYLEFVELAGGTTYPAFYYPSGGAWENTEQGVQGLEFDGYGLPNNTHVEIGVILPPEYYVDENLELDLEALGEGATFSMTFTIDDEAPEALGMSEDKTNKVLTVTAEDNQYVAAVALYNENGRLLTFTGSNAEAEAGQAAEFDLDLTEVGGNHFYLEVYDYAGNVTTYELNQKIGEIVNRLDGITVNPDAVTMKVGETEVVNAYVHPANSAYTSVYWVSSDTNVVKVNNGVLTAVGEGTAYVYAVSNYDDDFYGVCEVEVIGAGGNGKFNAFLWDPDVNVYHTEFDVDAPQDWEALSGDLYYHTANYSVGPIVSGCVGPDNQLYVASVSSQTGKGGIFMLDPKTYEETALSYAVVGGTYIFYTDLTYAPAMLGEGVILGTYGPYVIAIDPETGGTYGIIDELPGNIIGITTVESYYSYQDSLGWVYEDAVMMVLSDGTIILESYIGYDGYVFAYYGDLQETRKGVSTGKSMGNTIYMNSLYFDAETELLYWSALNTGTATASSSPTLYEIDLFVNGTITNMGNFGAGNYPVMGLHQLNVCPTISDINATGGAFAKTEYMTDVSILKDVDVSNFQFKTLDQNVVAEMNAAVAEYETAVKSVEVAGGASASYDQGDRIVVELNALDADGNAITTTNGLFTATYDPSSMTLEKVVVNGEYTAWVDNNGVVTIGYVDTDSIAAGEVIVKLYFVPTGDNHTVKVKYLEANDTEPNYSEKFNYTPPEGVVYGDLNDDGEITGKDLIMMRQSMAGWDVEINEANADVNGDGAVNGKDLILLRQFIAGWDVDLGIQ